MCGSVSDREFQVGSFQFSVGRKRWRNMAEQPETVWDGLEEQGVGRWNIGETQENIPSTILDLRFTRLRSEASARQARWRQERQTTGALQDAIARPGILAGRGGGVRSGLIWWERKSATFVRTSPRPVSDVAGRWFIFMVGMMAGRKLEVVAHGAFDTILWTGGKTTKVPKAPRKTRGRAVTTRDAGEFQENERTTWLG